MKLLYIGVILLILLLIVLIVVLVLRSPPATPPSTSPATPPYRPPHIPPATPPYRPTAKLYPKYIWTWKSPDKLWYDRNDKTPPISRPTIIITLITEQSDDETISLVDGWITVQTSFHRNHKTPFIKGGWQDITLKPSDFKGGYILTGEVIDNVKSIINDQIHKLLIDNQYYKDLEYEDFVVKTFFYKESKELAMELMNNKLLYFDYILIPTNTEDE